VQNDAGSLADLLAGVPVEVWSRWQNKAGKDLVSLSQERGSSAAYAVLVRALGIVQERRQAYSAPRLDIPRRRRASSGTDSCDASAPTPDGASDGGQPEQGEQGDEGEVEDKAQEEAPRMGGAAPGFSGLCSSAASTEAPTEGDRAWSRSLEDAASMELASPEAVDGVLWRQGVDTDGSCIISAGAPARAASAELRDAADADAPKKAACFRAVVQNDAEGLVELLGETSIDVWQRWENNAGKDLVSLSLERGSMKVYSVLVRALGIVQERKHSSLDRGDAVWVIEAGKVQPRQATVVEDVKDESEDVLLEFWDDNLPAMRVQRSRVSKAY